MEIKRSPILVVEHSDSDKFQDECRQLIEADYRLDSSHCGFVNSDAYDFCASYHAVFVDKLIED